MTKTIVMKFGGTSVGSPGAIRAAAELIRRYRKEGNRLVVVVSAMRGVTDVLIETAHQAVAGDEAAAQRTRQWLWDRHNTAAGALLPKYPAPVLDDIKAELDNFAN